MDGATHEGAREVVISGRATEDITPPEVKHSEILCSSCASNGGRAMLRCRYFACAHKFFHLECAVVEAQHQNGR